MVEMFFFPAEIWRVSKHGTPGKVAWSHHKDRSTCRGRWHCSWHHLQTGRLTGNKGKEQGSEWCFGAWKESRGSQQKKLMKSYWQTVLATMLGVGEREFSVGWGAQTKEGWKKTKVAQTGKPRWCIWTPALKSSWKLCTCNCRQPSTLTSALPDSYTFGR